MLNVSPDTGLVSHALPSAGRKKGKPQPSTTLVKERTVESGNPAALGCLGMHCVPEDLPLDRATELDTNVILSVGDGIELMEMGDHLYSSTDNEY